MLTAIRSLYAYNAWANERILATADRITQDQYLADAGEGSIRDTLVHTAAAQWLWLQRWLGASPPAMWDAAQFPNLPSLRMRWAVVEGETEEFIAALIDSDLDRMVSYVNFAGEMWTYPLWQQLLHQVNHATQHRSEAALLLTRFEASPGWLDYLVFIDERAT